jgi:adenylate cyclase
MRRLERSSRCKGVPQCTSGRLRGVTVGTEIERKYLLRELPAEASWTSEQRIQQGYLALDGPTEVRVRLRKDRATLTVKSGGGRSRIEEEVELDDRQAQALWTLTDGRRVEKVRRVSHVAGQTVEVDEYHGPLAGLLVAEVEFTDEAAAEAFVPPDWFGRELTDEAGYSNRELACHGRPDEE